MNYFVVAFILGFTYIAQASSQDAVLFVWSNQDPSLPNAADFVAVIDYNENSPTYGNILATTSLTQADGDIKTGNEAHHGAVSTNKKYLVTGGLLSFLSAAPALFIFSIDQANPQTAPTFEYSLSVPAGCVDDFFALDSPYDSSFVITAMCSSDATGTGAVFYLNAETQDLWTIIDGTTHQNLSSSFNPHGVDYDVDAGLLVTDYIVASTLLAPAASDIVFKSTIHRFSYQPGDKQAELVQTYEQDVEPPNPDQLGTGQGFMDARYAATDKHNRAYTTSTNTVELFLIDPRQAELKPVLDLGTVVGGSFAPSAGILQSTPDGQRLLVTFEMRYVILLDITDKENPKSLDVFDFCTDPSLDNYKFDHNGTKVTYSEFCAANSNFVGTHVVKLSGNYDNSVENRFTVVNYFLNFGLAQFPGSRTVHSFTFNHDRTKISIDLNFNPNPELYSLGSSPHVALYYPVNSGAQSSGSQQSSSNAGHLAPMLGFLLLVVMLL